MAESKGRIELGVTVVVDGGVGLGMNTVTMAEPVVDGGVGLGTDTAIMTDLAVDGGVGF